MALAFGTLTTAEETSTDGTQTTASISPPSGAVLIVTVAMSVSGLSGTNLSSASNTYTVSGLGGTWTQKGVFGWGSRREAATFIGTKGSAWGSGSLTVTASNGIGTLQDMAHLVDYVTGADTTTPTDAAVVVEEQTDSATLGDVGTVDTGDAVYVVAGHENGTNSLNATGYTVIANTGALSNIRQLESYYDDSSPDETPNLTSAGGGNGIGGIAFVVNVAAGGGPTEYTQSVAGTLTMAGALAKQAQVAKTGTLTSSGALNKRGSKSFTGTMTSAGAVVRQARKVLAGALTSSGALTAVKTALVSIAGSLSSAGAVARSTRKPLAGSVALVGSVAKQPTKAFTGALTSSGAIATVKAALVSLTGSLASAGALVRQTGKPQTGSLASAGALARLVSKTFSGTVASSGALTRIKAALVTVSGSLASAGALVRSTQKPLTGAVTFSGDLSRFVSKVVSGVITSSGDLAASIVGAVVAAVRVVTGIASRIITTGRDKGKDPDTGIQK